MNRPSIALVIAGGIPQPNEPLYTYSQGLPKAMIDINGRPMVGRVVDALLDADSIKEIVVVGLDQHTHREKVTAHRNVHFLPGYGSLLENVRSGLQWIRAEFPDSDSIYGSAADIPHVTGEMIDRFIERCSPWNNAIYYGYTTADQFKARYPNVKRTAVPMAEGTVFGADVFVIQPDVLDRSGEVWDQLTRARKNPFQIARMIGWRTVWRLMRSKVTIAELERIAGEFIGLPGQISMTQVPSPEMGMDGDLPQHIDALRETDRSG